MSVVSVFDVLLTFVLIVVYLNNHHWHVEHSQKEKHQNPNGNGHERRQDNVVSISHLILLMLDIQRDARYRKRLTYYFHIDCFGNSILLCKCFESSVEEIHIIEEIHYIK